jgi:diaminopimelate dehydrogenase
MKVGIVGYGNLGRGVLIAVDNAVDMDLVGIFTRREPSSVKPCLDYPVYSVNELEKFKNEIDVLILCGGSATDLPQTTVGYLKHFSTVDSFDTHAKIPEYFASVDKVAKENGNIGLISVGWDPGLFSIARLLFSSVLPNGKDYTFWGKGVSQGHSDAIRRIEGVKYAIQYTVPKEDAVNKVKEGLNPDLSTREKHLRVCYVVIKDGADKALIEKQIKEMPNYFKDYDTEVNFIDEETFKKEHNGLPHGGFVMRSGNTTNENADILEFSLKLGSNPEFTGSVLTAYARAVYRLKQQNKTGAITVFDVPLCMLSPLSPEELRKNLL